MFVIFDNDDWMTEGWVKLMGRDSVVVYLNKDPELKIKEGGCMRWLGEVWVEIFLQGDYMRSEGGYMRSQRG